MADAAPATLAAQLAQLAERRDPSRVLIGIAGGPGAGKTTLADRIAAELRSRGGAVAVVPLDGFHLARSVLSSLGLTEVKGAPHTFDAAGYVALLKRLRAAPATGELVYAPAFSRDLEEPVAGSIPVGPEVPIVLTEGNYLLLDDGPWAEVRTLLDAVWYLDPSDEVRVNRLVRRHVQFGRTPVDALRRATSGSDGANAAVIAASRDRADLVLRS